MAFNWFKKLKTGLSKSAKKVEKAFTSVIGKKKLDESALIELTQGFHERTPQICT